MLFYDRESNFEGIDVNRNSEPVSKECSFCHFNFFKDRNCNFSILFAIDIIIYQCILKFLSHMKTIVIKNNTY